MAVIYKAESSLAIPVCFHFASPAKKRKTCYIQGYSMSVQSIYFLLLLIQCPERPECKYFELKK